MPGKKRDPLECWIGFCCWVRAFRQDEWHIQIDTMSTDELTSIQAWCAGEKNRYRQAKQHNDIPFSTTEQDFFLEWKRRGLVRMETVRLCATKDYVLR